MILTILQAKRIVSWKIILKEWRVVIFILKRVIGKRVIKNNKIILGIWLDKINKIKQRKSQIINKIIIFNKNKKSKSKNRFQRIKLIIIKRRNKIILKRNLIRNITRI